MSLIPGTIEKHAVLRAPRERVWRAISEARQFGAWFGVEFDSEFVLGTRTAGKIAPTQADPEIAKLQEPLPAFRSSSISSRSNRCVFSHSAGTLLRSTGMPTIRPSR